MHKPAKPLRSGIQGMRVVPKNKTKGFGSRKCSHTATILWNDLHSTGYKKDSTFTFFVYCVYHVRLDSTMARVFNPTSKGQVFDLYLLCNDIHVRCSVDLGTRIK